MDNTKETNVDTPVVETETEKTAPPGKEPETAPVPEETPLAAETFNEQDINWAGPEAMVAQVAHEANRAFCQTLGDGSQVPWANASLAQRVSCFRGVKLHLDHPETTPAQSHESWMKNKIADGWKFGTVKNEQKKLHPCLVAYDKLDLAQQKKDSLFKSVVAGLRDRV